MYDHATRREDLAEQHLNIAMEKAIIEDLDVEKTSAPMILVIGQTGAGKSHFINRLVGKNIVKESARLFSCTSRPQLVEASLDNNDFLLVDTPGFNDTSRYSERSDAKILDEIARTLTLQTQLGVKLRGILYLYDITAKRMTGDTLRQLEMIKRICGSTNYQNVMLVTTHWPKDVETQKETGCPIREGDLRREFWKDMIRGGSKMWRFDDQTPTAKAIVRSLVGKKDITLALQAEMAAGKSLDRTTAGSYIVDARHQDERMLHSKTKALSADPANQGLLDEIKALQDSINNREEAEAKLKDDILKDIRNGIVIAEGEAKKRKMQRPTVANIISWLIGLSSLTAQVIQTAMS